MYCITDKPNDPKDTMLHGLKLQMLLLLYCLLSKKRLVLIPISNIRLFMGVMEEWNTQWVHYWWVPA